MQAEFDRRYRVWLNRQHARDSAVARQAVKDAEAEDAAAGVCEHGYAQGCRACDPDRP